MITLKHIAFRYPKKKEFSLTDITLSVHPGEIFTLLGPNGAGKTTLIRILAGLILPQRGSVNICGFDMLTQEYAAREKIGLVLGDERTFYFRLSGAQNLEFFGGLYGIERHRLKEQVRKVLSLVGLSQDAKLQFMRYSTGMRKRLNMARALLHDPEVLLLDEPNSGVDPESSKKIREIIDELRARNKTILLTTHDMEEAEKLSDRIGFLKEGKLVKIGVIEDFKRMIRKRTVTIEFSASSEFSREQVIALIREVQRQGKHESVTFRHNRLIISGNGSLDIDHILTAVHSSEARIESVNTSEASLEDVFLAMAR